jgi:hypothetical protein
MSMKEELRKLISIIGYVLLFFIIVDILLAIFGRGSVVFALILGIIDQGFSKNIMVAIGGIGMIAAAIIFSLWMED